MRLARNGIMEKTTASEMTKFMDEELMRKIERMKADLPKAIRRLQLFGQR